ncbi:MAG TPA: DUF1254 domain-containing protein [Bryobacteraceae bacterium]|jgi:DNA sulfur modification protein DndE
MSSQRFLVRIISAVVLISMTLPLAKSQASDQIGQINNESELTGLPVFSNGVAAYVYGYPLVLFGVTEKIAITVSSAGVKLGGAPLNQFGKEPGLPDSSFVDVVLPSTTTLYASAFINLKAEPIILHIPNITDRFFLLQMLDGWTNVSDKSPGSRLDSKRGRLRTGGARLDGYVTFWHLTGKRNSNGHKFHVDHRADLYKRYNR